MENVHDFSGENKYFWNPQVWRHLKEEYFLLVEWNKQHLALMEVDRSGAAAVADQLELLCNGKPSPTTPHIIIVKSDSCVISLEMRYTVYGGNCHLTIWSCTLLELFTPNVGF